MSQSAPAARPRIHLMDEVRGFAVLCMVVRHAFYLIGYLFDQPWAQAAFDFFAPVSPLFAGAFVLISGISSQLSHSNWARGAKLLAVSVGAIVYYIVLQIVLQIGLNTNDLKLITALIVALFLTLSYLNLKKTRRKPQRAAMEGVEQHA